MARNIRLFKQLSSLFEHNPAPLLSLPLNIRKAIPLYLHIYHHYHQKKRMNSSAAGYILTTIIKRRDSRLFELILEDGIVRNVYLDENLEQNRDEFLNIESQLDRKKPQSEICEQNAMLKEQIDQR